MIKGNKEIYIRLIAINLIITLLCCGTTCYSLWNDDRHPSCAMKISPIKCAAAAPDTAQNNSTTDNILPAAKPDTPSTMLSVLTTDLKILIAPTEPASTVPGTKPGPQPPVATEPSEPTIPENSVVPDNGENKDHVCNGDHVLGEPCVESYTAGSFEYIRSESCKICGYIMRSHWMINPCTDPHPDLTKGSMDIFLGILNGFEPIP